MSKSFTPSSQPSSNSEMLNHYAQTFAELNANNFRQTLTPLLSEQVFFKDPFNAVHGKAATLEIFAHMFALLEAPKFSILHAAYHQNIGYIHWTFSFQSKQKSMQIEGLSQIHFDESGLINKHIDFWDTGEQLYHKIPILNWVLGRIATKLRCKTAQQLSL